MSFLYKNDTKFLTEEQTNDNKPDNHFVFILIDKAGLSYLVSHPNKPSAVVTNKICGML